MEEKEPLGLPLISEVMMNSYFCGFVEKCITSETGKLQDSASYNYCALGHYASSRDRD